MGIGGSLWSFKERVGRWANAGSKAYAGWRACECLNREQFWTLTEARVVVEDFRRDYNEDRPHSRLGYLSPRRFAATQAPSLSPVGLRLPYARDGQTPTNTTTSTQSSDSHTA
jgi:hypothetical protein